MSRFTPRNVLIVAPNWMGDCIMLMPAVQEFRRVNTGVRVTVLARAPLDVLWRLSRAVDVVLAQDKRARSLPAGVAQLQHGRYDAACIVPNSFRSALLPFLAGIPVRRGFHGHARCWMLTDALCACVQGANSHQVFEGAKLLGIDVPHDWRPRPDLDVPDSVEERNLAMFGLAGMRYAVIMPGAARGPSKQWPGERYIELGRRLYEGLGLRLVVIGTADEAELCDHIANSIGNSALCLAGKTGVEALVALLSASALVVCNDSGGMHLAAALGCHVVAVFGITDPDRTGPLGEFVRVLTPDGVACSRDIPKDSIQARRALLSISAERVYSEAADMLEGNPNEFS